MQLRGSDFVALVWITDAQGNVLATVGQTCERVPIYLLTIFEGRGKIRRIAKKEINDG